MQTLRDMSDWLRNKLGSAVVVLATAVDDKPQFIAAVTDDLVKRGVHAGELVKAWRVWSAAAAAASLAGPGRRPRSEQAPGGPGAGARSCSESVEGLMVERFHVKG